MDKRYAETGSDKMRTINKDVRKAVLDRDSWEDCPCCIYCGKPLKIGAHLHHVIRRSKGGKDVPENLVTLCSDCHGKLHNGDKDIEKYTRLYLQSFYGKGKE